MRLMREGTNLSFGSYRCYFCPKVTVVVVVRVDHNLLHHNLRVNHNDLQCVLARSEALIDGLHFNFVRATEEQIEKYKEEAEVFHGGSAEDSTTDTSISDKDAEEPSRAPLR